MNTKQVIVVRKDLGMSKGKLAAQVAHASMEFLIYQLRNTWLPSPHCTGLWCSELTVDNVEKEWIDNSFAKVVLWVEDEAEFHDIAARANQHGLKVHKIQDEGRTQFSEPTWTAVGIGPDECEIIDQVTGHLKLVR